MQRMPQSNLDGAAFCEAAKISGLSLIAIESLAQAGQLVAEREGQRVKFKARTSFKLIAAIRVAE